MIVKFILHVNGKRELAVARELPDDADFGCIKGRLRTEVEAHEAGQVPDALTIRCDLYRDDLAEPPVEFKVLDDDSVHAIFFGVKEEIEHFYDWRKDPSRVAADHDLM